MLLLLGIFLFVRNFRMDSNGIGSSWIINIFINISIINVSLDREEIILGKVMNLKVVVERWDGMEEYLFVKGKKCFIGKEVIEEYLIMYSILRRNVNKNGEICVLFYRFENIIEVVEFY